MIELDLLDNLVCGSLPILKLGMREHAILAGRSRAVVEQVLAGANNVCACCGTTVQQGLEVHPRDGNHNAYTAENLIALCQACHYAFHPLWSFSNKRVQLFWGPEMSQVDINRLYWGVAMLSDTRSLLDDEKPSGLMARLAADDTMLGALARHMASASDEEPLEDIGTAITYVVDDVFDVVEARQSMFARILGSENPEAFVEAMFQVRDVLDPAEFRETVAFLKTGLRYWPDITGIVWDRGLVKDVSIDLIEANYNGDGPFAGASLSNLISQLGQEQGDVVSAG